MLVPIRIASVDSNILKGCLEVHKSRVEKVEEPSYRCHLSIYTLATPLHLVRPFSTRMLALIALAGLKSGERVRHFGCTGFNKDTHFTRYVDGRPVNCGAIKEQSQPRHDSISKWRAKTDRWLAGRFARPRLGNGGSTLCRLSARESDSAINMWREAIFRDPLDTGLHNTFSSHGCCCCCVCANLVQLRCINV